MVTTDRQGDLPNSGEGVVYGRSSFGVAFRTEPGKRLLVNSRWRVPKTRAVLG